MHNRDPRRDVILILVSQAAFGVTSGLFDTVYNLHLASLGISTALIGTILLCGLGTMAICVVPITALSRATGQHRIMLWSSTAFALSILGLLVVRTFTAQLVVFTLSAVLSAVMLAVVTAELAAHIPDDTARYRAFRWNFVALLAGQAVGNLGASWLADPAAAAGQAYRAPLLAAFVAGLVMAALRLGTRAVEPAAAPAAAGGAPEDTPAGTPADPTGPTAAAQGPGVATLRTATAPKEPKGPLVIGVLGLLIGAFSVIAIRLLNIVLVDHFGVSVVHLGYLFTSDRIVSAISILALVPLLTRFGEVRATAVLLVLVLPLQILGTLATTAALFMLPYLLRQSIYYSQMPVLDLVTNRGVEPGRRVHNNAVQKMGFFGGSAVGAQVYAALLGRDMVTASFVLSGCCAAAAGGIYWVFFREPPVARPRHVQDPSPTARRQADVASRPRQGRNL